MLHRLRLNLQRQHLDPPRPIILPRLFIAKHMPELCAMEKGDSLPLAVTMAVLPAGTTAVGPHSQVVETHQLGLQVGLRHTVVWVAFCCMSWTCTLSIWLTCTVDIKPDGQVVDTFQLGLQGVQIACSRWVPFCCMLEVPAVVAV